MKGHTTIISHLHQVFQNPEAPTIRELAQAENIADYIVGAAQYFWHAQDELLWRLNTRLQGTDPGRPVNWRGLHEPPPHAA